MTFANSKPVRSLQDSLHNNLEVVVQKHLQHSHLKPAALHTVEAFQRVINTTQTIQRPIHLDSGCGTGESTIFLGTQRPDCWVIGIDKSEERLRKALKNQRPENVVFQRADQFDFWRLARRQELTFEHHFLFYPNPWPKKEHLKRRIHGHPAFVDLLKISKRLTLRSNWQLFLEEFAAAYELATSMRGIVYELAPRQPITLFEKKFISSGHPIYEFSV